MSRAVKGALGLAAVAVALDAARQRRRPAACPYSQRWMLLFPRPGLTRGGLADILEPRAGERLLELGPGTGHYTLAMAERVGTRGAITAFDLQQEMLDDLGAAAERRGVGNVELRQGDATSLPYEDASFDGAYLVTVLGEIPDQAAALRELRRVLAEAAGLRFERSSGLAPLGFYVRFAAT